MKFVDAHNAIAAARTMGERSPLLLAAETFADEVDRLNAELEQVRQDFQEIAGMLQQFNDALADTFPTFARDVDVGTLAHPAARLRIVTADTAAPCDQ